MPATGFLELLHEYDAGPLRRKRCCQRERESVEILGRRLTQQA